MLFIFTNPLIPKVDGKAYDNTFQKGDIAAPGQEIPERKRRGTDVNTNISIQVSRFLITTDAVSEKKTHAIR